MTLKEILLVDDSLGTNILNKRLLEAMEVCGKVSVAVNGQLALDYLLSKIERGEDTFPELIFVDISMPVMDGYQFIDKFHELGLHEKMCSSFVMLTTSKSMLDVQRTSKYERTKGLKIKPLLIDDVKEIMEDLSATF